MKALQAHQVACQNCGRENRLPAAAASFPRCGHCHRPVPWIVDASDDNFTEIAEDAAIPVLVDIWAPWCVHRRRLRPALEKLACDLADQVKVVNVNVDETPRLQVRFGVEAVPTLVLLRGTRIVAYQAGAPPEPSLRAWLAQALGESETMQAGEPCPPANPHLPGLAEHVMWPELLRSTVGMSASASESRARGSRGRAMKSDSEIREDVIRELQWDPQVPDPEAIGVAVKDGAVTLTGNVPTYGHKLATVRAASRVYGVKAVADELKVKLAGDPRDDSDIARAIAHVLEWNTQIPDGQVHARVQAGWVMLEGEVEWDYQRHEVERMVRNVRGVVGITNNILIKPRVSADEIESRIDEAFKREAGVDTRHITVEVSDHTARLYGHVHSLNEANAASAAVAAAPGVSRVENHLVVSP